MPKTEEFQSTKDELVTSTKDRQSLNEELAGVNAQRQDAVHLQRSASNDLQNVLDSSGVATLLLDGRLCIRFFTPAAKAIFPVIATDIGRPLGDFKSLAEDPFLLEEAAGVLATLTPAEREVCVQNGRWYLRRIVPCRTQDNHVEGVVITYSDVTDRRQVAEALEKARRDADQANLGKSRFLTAASHDLRQPLQTITLLQGIMAKTLKDEPSLELVMRLDESLGVMSDLLDTLLEINQLEAGAVSAQAESFRIGDLLSRLEREFAYEAQARGLYWRVVPCTVTIRSDQQLLEQILRNLVSNAIKYTTTGGVLLGCRKRGDRLRIEVWDTGPGIPETQLRPIFDEFHQLDNPGRERSRGLGLGLAIVQRLAILLDHPLEVRSRVGRGSDFSVELPIAAELPCREPVHIAASPALLPGLARDVSGATILIVENDARVRESLKLLLEGEGNRVIAALGSEDALELVMQEGYTPDLVIADFKLSSNLDGLQLIARLRTLVQRGIPAIVLTGDISTDTLRAIARAGHLHLHKPATAKSLIAHIYRLLARAPSPGASDRRGPTTEAVPGAPKVFVVDDHRLVRAAMRDSLQGQGWHVDIFASCEAFLGAYRRGERGCLVVDDRMPGMTGIQLLERLRAGGDRLPVIIVTGYGEIRTAVEAMKAGAADFLEKPVGREALLATIHRVLALPNEDAERAQSQRLAAERLGHLTTREREVMERVLAGHASKNIAADLRISQRTVENHRASLMKKSGTRSLAEFIRLALAAREAWQEGRVES